MAKKSSKSSKTTAITTAQKPKGQRSTTQPFVISRLLPSWSVPNGQTTEAWRNFVRTQPICIAARDTLISFVIGSDWKIDAREPAQSDELKDEAQRLTDKFNHLGGEDFDGFLDVLCQDLLDAPFGGAAEVGRENDDPEGEIEWVENLDAATLYPTYDFDFPVGQRVPWQPQTPVYFPRHAINRAYLTPRPEILKKGWGMAPPEKIYLAVALLTRGDQYYANLLLDTPEAGVLDLADMKKETAMEWLSSFQQLFSGIDPFKVPVLYEHEKAANFIPFGRPPTELIFDSVTFKYAQIVCAGYGIRISDIGMAKDEAKTLAGVIRSERQTRRTGFAVIKSKIKGFMDRLLPPYLQFIWIDHDDESMIAKGRARLANAQAYSELYEKQILKIEEIRGQIRADKLYDVDIDPENTEGLRSSEELAAPAKGSLDVLKDRKVAPSSGGHGEIKMERKSIPTIRYALKTAYGGTYAMAENSRIRKMLRVATEYVYKSLRLSYGGLKEEDRAVINTSIVSAIFGNPDLEIFDNDMLIALSKQKESISTILKDDGWWKVSDFLTPYREDLSIAFVNIYEQAALKAKRALTDEMYEINRLTTLEGREDFSLNNKKYLKKLSKQVDIEITKEDNEMQKHLKAMVLSSALLAISKENLFDTLIRNSELAPLFEETRFLKTATEIFLEGLSEFVSYRAEQIPKALEASLFETATTDFMEMSGISSDGWKLDENKDIILSNSAAIEANLKLWKGD